MQQKRAVAGGRHDDSAAGQVSLRDAPVEGIGVTLNECQDPREVARFVGVGRPELLQRRNEVQNGAFRQTEA